MKEHNNFDDLYCDIGDILDGRPDLDHLYTEIMKSISTLFQNSNTETIGDGNGYIFKKADIVFPMPTWCKPHSLYGMILPHPPEDDLPYQYQILFAPRASGKKYLTISIYTKGVHFTVPKITACWDKSPLTEGTNRAIIS